MKINLLNKNFLTLLDFSLLEIRYLLDLSHSLKKKRQNGVIGTSLSGKNIALLFEKSSTRTRCAFEISIIEEGGYCSIIDIASSQFGKKESVADSAKVLACFYNGLVFRGYAQKNLETLATYSGIPVYNALTDNEHPTQILADLMTIEEFLPDKPLSKIKIVYVGDTNNNVATAWIYACAILGMHFVACGPKELHPRKEVLEKVAQVAINSKAIIELSENKNCLNGADVIYNDVWISMGEETKALTKVELLKDYKVTMNMLSQTNNPRVLFMHCLPAFHDKETLFAKTMKDEYNVDIREVTDEVFNSKHSVVFAEAANRLHTIKAILIATLSNNECQN